MRRIPLFQNSGFAIFCALVLLLLFIPLAHADNSVSASQADHDFVQAFEKKDRAALQNILDPDFIWIDANGRRLTRAECLGKVPVVANANIETQTRNYGNVEVVHANHERMNVLRVWVKRAAGWRIVLYQEVLQVEKSEPPGGTPSVECVNPCKSIPYQPQTQSEREAIASWQGVMKAMTENDPEAYSPLIAEEFTATDTYHDRPYTKTDRLSQISEQKQKGKRSAPPELLFAEMFDFGDSVLMVAKEQRPGGKSYFNSRVWVKRDTRWQMLFSFNTRIE
jgi:hypothetical protein